MNENLNKAKKAQYDEYYTQMTDIEKELSHYRLFLKKKIVYCNCDNPYWSNFVQYFVERYEELGLRGVIATCIRTQKTPAYYLIYRGGGIRNVKLLQGDGDFRSAECIELLKQSDIVVTNPPFSLAREHYDQIREYDKDCILMGNMNAVGYNSFFPDLQTGKLRVGWNNGHKTYESPNTFINQEIPKEKKGYIKIKNGRMYVMISAINWYTTFPIERNLSDIELKLKYNPELHPKIDNYNAIFIDRIKNIPSDYAGVMAVPITIFHYNHHQWEILGMTSRKFENGLCNTTDADAILNGKSKYKRILIKNRRLNT